MRKLLVSPRCFTVPAVLKMAPVKRYAYEVSLKLKAIEYAVMHGNRAAAREFNVNESMVQKWRKQVDALRQVKKNKLNFWGHKARWPQLQLEDRIEQWVIAQRTAKRSVSTISIWLKAKALAGELDIKNFQGTPSWCFHFMKQHNLSIHTRTTVSQQLTDDYQEKVMLFLTYCTNMIND